MKKRRLQLYVRLPLCLWCMLMFVFLSPVLAQEKQYSVQIQKGPLEQAIIKVRSVSGQSIVYHKEEIGGIDITAMNLQQQTVGDILKTLLRDLPFKVEKRGAGWFIEKNTASDKKKRVTGQVTDAANGQPIPGVTIVIRGTKTGTQSDIQGNFSIETSDNDILGVSFVGYAGEMIPVGGKTRLVIRLKLDTRTLGGVTVEARKKANTELALLKDRRNASVVSDAISAQHIEKTASITTTQALQRVTGVTITDDKYVAVRGLGDRSVIAELNGARLSSSNPDRSAVPLDLVPAGLLDNLTVYKTLTPDRPADASAGLIELKTKSVPETQVLEFTAQAGYNSTVGLRGQYNGFYNSDLGFFGKKVSNHNLSQDFINLGKQYPGGLPEIQKLFLQSRNSPELAAEARRVSNIMQSFDPVLTTKYQRSSPNQVYTVNYGNSFKVFNGHTLGVVASANYYQRTSDIYNATRNQYSLFQGVVTGSPSIFNPLRIPAFVTPNYHWLSNYISYKENTGTRTLNYGALLGLTYQFNKRNEIQAQYVGSRGAESEGSNLTGAWQNTGINFPVYNVINQLRVTYRTFDTYNFQGEHQILDKAWSPRLSYNLSSSRSTQTDPDFRSTDVANKRTTRFQDPNGVGIGEDTYAFVSGLVHGVGSDNSNIIVADPNGRQYRKLKETNYNGKADLSQPFKVGGLDQLLKFGFNILRRERDFTENILGIPGSTLGGGGIKLLNDAKGNIDQLVSPANSGLQNPNQYDGEGQPRVGGFLYQIKKAPNNYSGSYETRAFYAMLDARLPKDIRLTGGVRFESTDIQANVDTTDVFVPQNLNALTGLPKESVGYSTKMPHTRYVSTYKPYYSANLVYSGIKDMNFRFGYSTSLARPELRELTNVFEFDPFQFAVIGGNPNLKNQLTRSADFRWEWFNAPGEILSASVFTKTIINPLQRVFIYNQQGNLSTAPEFPLIIYQNDPNNGKVYGVELEIRRDLGKLWRPLNHLFIGTNLLFDVSTIDKNPERLNASRINDRRSSATSPVFEQAPYAINTYLDYSNTNTGTTITTSFNIVGARLIQVQLDGTPDLYDRPVPVLDFVFSQRLGKRWLARGFAKNILDPAYKTVYTNPGNNGKFYGTEYIYRQYHKGTEFSLGLTYKLF